VRDGPLRAATAVVASLGLLVSSYLTWVHYEPAALVCTRGGGCETVQQSDYAVLLGIPVALLGTATWAAVLILVLRDGPTSRALMLALALAALAFVAYLVILQLFVIDAVCIWCMVNDVVLVPLLVVVALLRYRTGDERATS
jgi:uncharacterized membrane protein